MLKNKVTYTWKQLPENPENGNGSAGRGSFWSSSSSSLLFLSVKLSHGSCIWLCKLWPLNSHLQENMLILPLKLQLEVVKIFAVFYLFQVVKLLLRYGGDPRQSNRRGETPLKVANSPTMLNLLLGKGTYTSSEESSSGMLYKNQTVPYFC